MSKTSQAAKGQDGKGSVSRSSTERPYLRFDHIDKSFTRGSATTEVLKDISLTIDKGEYVAIIGHSGCGKSTLLNIVRVLTPVTAGAVLLEDREVNAPGPSAQSCSRTTRCCPGSLL